MTNQTQGIQQLLAAEKKAADKVGEARKRKNRRLKQAKDEATEEIEKYRQEREKQFKEAEATHVGSREGVVARIEKDTDARLAEMTRALTSHKEVVINDVLRFVYDIVPTVHKNYRLDAGIVVD